MIKEFFGVDYLESTRETDRRDDLLYGKFITGEFDRLANKALRFLKASATNARNQSPLAGLHRPLPGGNVSDEAAALSCARRGVEVNKPSRRPRQSAEKWQTALATGEPLELETRYRRADEQYRWFLVRSVPLRDEIGNIVTWYATYTDIDDRKQAASFAVFVITICHQRETTADQL